MGKLTYDGSFEAVFDDRLLAHLQVVMGMKLRRNESFFFSWRDDDKIGDGRTSLWVHPTSSLVFKYYGGRAPQINVAWVKALEVSANSNSGLHLVPKTQPGQKIS